MLRLTSRTTTWPAVPGIATEIPLELSNGGEIPEEISVDALGERAAWCRIEPSPVSLGPGQSAALRMVVTVPADAGDGPHGLLLRARCLSDAAVLSLRVTTAPGTTPVPGGNQPAETAPAGTEGEVPDDTDDDRRPVPLWLPLVVTVVMIAVVLAALLLFGPEVTPQPY